MDEKYNSIKGLGKIGILMGGATSERDISLKSGNSIVQSLQSINADVIAFDVIDFNSLVKAAKKVDCVFIALHGRWGEGGTVQAILQSLNKPFTGSGMEASAIAMNKLRTKLLWRGANIPTPKFMFIDSKHPFTMQTFVNSGLNFPVIVKPVHEGSSIGMRKVYDEKQLLDAIKYAKTFDDSVLVEQWIVGREFTATILCQQVLPLIELKTDHDFYDFDAKYCANTTQYISPVNIASNIQKQIKDLALESFRILGAKDWGRVDIMLDEQNQPYMIELNTVPGMTNHSLVPMSAKQAGIEFTDLVLKILTPMLKQLKC